MPALGSPNPQDVRESPVVRIQSLGCIEPSSTTRFARHSTGLPRRTSLLREFGRDTADASVTADSD